MSTEKQKHATRGQLIAIHKKLEVELEKHEGNFCSYKNPAVDDQTIADEIGVKKSSVSGIRLELFGKFRPAPEFDHRVGELAVAIKSVSLAHDDLRDHYNKLVKLLALNRVVDCKHLEI